MCKSKSYKPFVYNNGQIQHCYHDAEVGEPCWGQVDIYYEEYEDHNGEWDTSISYLCEGHQGDTWDYKYIKEEL